MSLRRNLSILLLVFIGFCGSGAADTLVRPDGVITDAAGVIDAPSRGAIAAVIDEIRQKTTAEIAVVTVTRLPEQSTIESFAVPLFASWGIGKKGKDNGVLLIAAIEDRRVRIEVGYGLEGILPDGKCGEILDRYILPEFRSGAYGTGLLQGTRAIASVIAADAGVTITGRLPVAPAKKASPLEAAVSLIVLFLLFLFFLRHPVLFLLLLGGGRHGGGFGSSNRGGFGGFGGGMSGGGGASRGW
jgi:uncharacterized protein